ncbi:unnamed protein product [Cunninghamella echinulata]
MLGALSNHDLASIILQSIVVSYAFELCIRNLLYLRDDKAFGIHLGKCLLGLFFAVKTSFFLSFYINQGEKCFITGRFADIFYHLGMACGDFVLLSRVHSIVPIPWKRASIYSIIIIVLTRTIVGIIDTVLLFLDYDEYGKCIYHANYYVGPIYTFLDLGLDVYICTIISYILITHIRRLEDVGIPMNLTLYIGVIVNNIIRTVALTIVNLISGIFLIRSMSGESIMLVWPIINLFVVVLIGYDSDVTKTIISLQNQQLNKVNKVSSTGSSPPITDSNQQQIKSGNNNYYPYHHQHHHHLSDVPLGQIHSTYSSYSNNQRHHTT